MLEFQPQINQYIRTTLQGFPESGVTLIQSDNDQALYALIFEEYLTSLFLGKKVFTYNGDKLKQQDWWKRYLCRVGEGDYDMLSNGITNPDVSERFERIRFLSELEGMFGYEKDHKPVFDEVFYQMKAHVENDNVDLFIIDHLNDFGPDVRQTLDTLQFFARENHVCVIALNHAFQPLAFEHVDKLVTLNTVSQGKSAVFYRQEQDRGRFNIDYDSAMQITTPVYRNYSSLEKLLFMARAGLIGARYVD